jgi:hypothetical protein
MATAKLLMTQAAEATLRGDRDAVERTEAALAALEEERRHERQSPAKKTQSHGEVDGLVA